MACLCKVEDEGYLIEKLVETMEGMEEEQRKDYIMNLLTLTELRPNLRIRLSEEVRHMPIVVRPEDIKLPKRKLRKDILYRLGHEEGFLKALQDTVLTAIRGKLGRVPEGVEVRVKSIRDREYLNALIEKLINSGDVLELLREERLLS